MLDEHGGDKVRQEPSGSEPTYIHIVFRLFQHSLYKKLCNDIGPFRNYIAKVQGKFLYFRILLALLFVRRTK